MDQLIAVHEIHGIEVEGKKAVIAPGKTFTPNSAKQRDTLLEKGAAKLVPKAVDEDDAEEEGYAAMTVAQLKALAKERNLDLGGATKKDPIIAVIEAADNATGDEGGNDGEGLV